MTEKRNILREPDTTLLNRRSVLIGTGALLVSGLPQTGIALPEDPILEPRPARVSLLPPKYPASDIWGYNGTTPGPEIRVQQGDRVARRLVNSLPQPTAIHWHGIRIDNRMDGVPGVTQDAVEPGDTFDYDFVVPDAGTYWYHSHNQSTEQVARGLYGALVVEEADPPDVDLDQVLILDDWLIEQSGLLVDAFNAPQIRSHAGLIGNYVTTNSRFDYTTTARKNDRLRLRLINAATARIFTLGLQGLEGWIVAVDGMPLAEPAAATERILLAPAQRVDLIVDVTATPGDAAFLVHEEDGSSSAQAVFEVGEPVRKMRRDPPPALPQNTAPSPSKAGSATYASLMMEGGAMSGMQSAIMNGKKTEFRELAQNNQFWAFNGTIGMPEKPLIHVAIGETVRLIIENRTVFPHAIHLHGQHFREVDVSGTLGPMRDTVLVFAQQSSEIAFIASNPGDWLLHCHMLSHQAAGMKTWIRVS